MLVNFLIKYIQTNLITWVLHTNLIYICVGLGFCPFTSVTIALSLSASVTDKKCVPLNDVYAKPVNKYILHRFVTYVDLLQSANLLLLDGLFAGQAITETQT